MDKPTKIKLQKINKLIAEIAAIDKKLAKIKKSSGEEWKEG